MAWKTIGIGLPDNVSSAIIGALDAVRQAGNVNVSLAQIMAKAPTKNVLTWALREAEARAMTSTLDSVEKTLSQTIQKALGVGGIYVIAWSATDEIDLLDVALAKVGITDDSLPPEGPTTLGTRVLDVLVNEANAPSGYDRWLTKVEHKVLSRAATGPNILPLIKKDINMSAVVMTVEGPSAAVVNYDYQRLKSMVTGTYSLPEKQQFEDTREGFEIFARNEKLFHEANKNLFTTALPKEEKLNIMNFAGAWDKIIYGVNRSINHYASSLVLGGSLVDMGKFQASSVLDRTLRVLQENTLNLLRLRGSMLYASGQGLPGLFDEIREQSKTRKDPVQVTRPYPGSGLKQGQVVSRKEAHGAADYITVKEHYVAGLMLIFPTGSTSEKLLKDDAEADDVLPEITKVEYGGTTPSPAKPVQETEVALLDPEQKEVPQGEGLSYGVSELWAIGYLLNEKGLPGLYPVPVYQEGLGVGPKERFVELAQATGDGYRKPYSLTADALYSARYVFDQGMLDQITPLSAQTTVLRKVYSTRSFLSDNLATGEEKTTNAAIQGKATNTVKVRSGSSVEIIDGPEQELSGSLTPFYTAAKTQNIKTPYFGDWYFQGEVRIRPTDFSDTVLSYQTGPAQGGDILRIQGDNPTGSPITATSWMHFDGNKPGASPKSLIPSGHYLLKIDVPFVETESTRMGVEVAARLGQKQNQLEETILRTRDLLVQLRPSGEVVVRERTPIGWRTRSLTAYSELEGEEFVLTVRSQYREGSSGFEGESTEIRWEKGDGATAMLEVPTLLQPLQNGTFSIGYGYLLNDQPEVIGEPPTPWSPAPPPMIIKETKLRGPKLLTP